MIAPSAELTEVKVEREFVGSPRECISVVDRNLLISDVCKVFGQFVKYNVVMQLSEQEPTTVGRSIPNTFTVLMDNSAKQSIAARKSLPDKMNCTYILD